MDHERHGVKRRLTDENELEILVYNQSVQQIEVLTPELFKDNLLSVGGHLKARGDVLKQFVFNFRFPKGTRMVCRVEVLAGICKTFDKRRRLWVEEMGFGGLLNIPEDMVLPREFAYWLMTRIDPLNKILISPDGKDHKLSSNEIHWVFGIPNGGKEVPTYESLNEEMLEKVRTIRESYGKGNKSKGSGALVCKSKPAGISVSKEMMNKIKGEWEEDQQDEFKTLFLLLALNMLLCPTSSHTLVGDLVPALTCAANAAEYDWCSLMLEKLMESVATFARQFYSYGYTASCTGCLIFPVVFYLDRLDRNPVKWGFFPRLQVWDMKQIESVCEEDQLPQGGVNELYWNGDYGQLGTLDVSYGERHPREATDTAGPVGGSQTLDVAYGERHLQEARDTAGPGGSQTLDVAYGERHPQEARDTTGPVRGSQTLDVAYGERHPCEARDTAGPVGGSQVMLDDVMNITFEKANKEKVVCIMGVKINCPPVQNARDTAGPVGGSQTLDVAYGERHPREARDTARPVGGSQVMLDDVMNITIEKANKEKVVCIMGVKINCPPDQNS